MQAFGVIHHPRRAISNFMLLDSTSYEGGIYLDLDKK
jgi:hypothetical protein